MISAERIYLATSLVWGMLFWMMATVFMVYQIEIVNLDPLQLVLVGTALELGAFLFEVPTGVVADTWSRKLSVIIGYVVTGGAFIAMGLMPFFEALLIASFIWGIGWTFISGAHPAWLADEVGETGAARAYLVGARMMNIGAFVGILLAVVLARWATHYPLLIAGFAFAAWGLALIVLMPERGFTRTGRASVAGMLGTVRDGISVVRASSVLVLLILVGVVFGAFSEGYDRLSAAQLLRNLDMEAETGLRAVDAFGAMTAAGILLSIVVVMLAERFVDTEQTAKIRRSLSRVTVLIIVAVVIFALSGNVWLAIGLYILLQPLRQLIGPLTMAWFNRDLPSASRATVISLHSQADALGQIAGGPAVGLLGREFGIRIAITVAGLLLLPAIWLYSRGRLHTGTAKD